MATFTSAPIGSTAQSLDGLNVSTAGGPALFLEAVAIGDPTDGGALAPVSSTLGLSVNVASTVAQAVNVSVVANQITSSIPFYVAQSSGPWSVQGTTNVQGTSSVNLLGTASTQIISSIPFYVAQSSAPWTVVATATVQGTSSVNVLNAPTVNVTNVPLVTVQGTSSVNVLGNITIQGTSSVNVLGAVPGTTQVNVVSSLPITIQGTSSVNVLGSIPGTTQVNVVSSLALTIQGTSSVNILGAIPSTSFVSISSTVPLNVVGTSSVNILGTVPITGTSFAFNTPTASTAGGLTRTLKTSLADTNSTVAKASAGMVYSYSVGNAGSTWVWLKLMDSPTAIPVTSATFIAKIGVPASTQVSQEFAYGLAFSTGIYVALTGKPDNQDNTAVTASTCVINLFWK